MELTAVLVPAEEGGYVAFNPETGARREVTSGAFVMVAVDEAGSPVPIGWKPGAPGEDA